MIMLPADHPLRLQLADEVHARPFEPIATPSRLSYVALLLEPEQREAERAHLARLIGLAGAAGKVPVPDAQTTHLRLDLGALRLKWERHGEFSGFTLIAAGADPGAPFDRSAAELLPAGWLQALPGCTVVAVHAVLLPAGAAPPAAAEVARHFGGNPVVGAAIGGDAGHAFTDFRLHADGCSRMLVLDAGFTRLQAGRMLQRLFEIEAYRMLALLALPIARRLSPRIVAIENALAELTGGIAREDGDEEALLQELTRLAAEVESGLAASQFRFGACRAYGGLVQTRVADLREQRLPGLQTFGEFMARRFAPAVDTCQTVSQRLHELSDRVAQASSLLATRVGIAREQQNQQLLASMDRRARMSLRLQQTVEGLSVAAILYYLLGLIGYGAKGLRSAGVPIDPDTAVGAAIPLAGLAVWWVVRRARRLIEDRADGP